MLIPNHPSDERLSALVARDPEGTADASLATHVSTCIRCTGVVNELGALRASLADLPDLQPSRPLRFLPEVPEPAPSGFDRLGGWARRFFAPVLTAGAALAMVGLVGTAAPTFQGADQNGGAAPNAALNSESEPGSGDSAAQGGGGEGRTAASEAAAAAESVPLTADGADEETAEGMEPLLEGSDAAGRDIGAEAPASYDDRGDDDAATGLPAERSPWPMVLFTGVALMVAAALLRWILVPRAG